MPPDVPISVPSSRTCASTSSSRIEPCGVSRTRRSSSARSSGRVAAPGQRGQQRQRRTGQRLDRHVARAADLFQEVIRQERNVLAPLPERRQLDANQREAFVEIAAEPAFLDGGLEAGIDGRDGPDVELDAAAVAQDGFAIAKDAVQLALHARRHLAAGSAGTACRRRLRPAATRG